MWSRWKPIEWNVPTMTEAAFAEASYGIKTPTSVSDPLNAPAYSYEYKRPNGGNLSPYRIGDFRNYYHQAESPCYKQQNIKIYTVSASQVVFYPNVNTWLNSNNVQIQDLMVAGKYPALVLPITQSGQTTIYYRTAEVQLYQANEVELSVTYKLNEPPFNGNRSLISQAFWVGADKPYLYGNSEPQLQSFTSLPYMQPEDAFFDIEIDRFSPVTFVAQGLCRTATQTHRDEIVDYDGTGAWYTLNSDATLFIECEIRNDTSRNTIFNEMYFKMNATNTFANGYNGKPTGEVSPQLWVYRNGWQRINFIDMPSGSREQIRLGIPGFLTHYRGIEYRPTTGDRPSVSTKIKYNGVNLTSVTGINYRI